MRMRSFSCAAGALCLVFSAALAHAAEAKPATRTASAETKKEESGGPLQNLKFRNLGPAAGGGRVSAIAGIPGEPNTIYVGSCSGGVFKTIDGGLSWKAIFEKHPPSIGAIAVAPSNSSLVWVGTGEPNPGNNSIDGNGVYFSADG